MLFTGPHYQSRRADRTSRHSHQHAGPALLALKYMLLILLIFSTARISRAQIPISADLFGQNAWWINNDDSPYPDQLDALFDDVAASGVKYVRIGGIEANYNVLWSWNSSTYAITDASKLTGLIDEIRSHGMEPIIQVGHNPNCSTRDMYGVSLANQALIAGNLVGYLNNTVYPSDPIEYWIIANEPDLGTNCPGGGFGWNDYDSPNFHTTNIANMIKEYSTKMKNADPDIQIIGPELATFGPDKFYDVNKIMNDLISAPANANSIMGTIATGNGTGEYYVDVISFHTYPSPTNRTTVINQPLLANTGYAAKLLNDGSSTNQWRGIIEMIEGNSTNRNASNLKIACTEFNLEHLSGQTDETTSTNHTNVLRGHDNRSFLAGQWMTEVFLVSMGFHSGNTPWMKFMNPWSIKEGDCDDGFGYINSCSAWEDEKRPSYWHYTLLAEHFAGGTLYPVTPESGNADNHVKAYVCTKGGNVKVLVLNQKTNSTQSSASNTSISIRFDNNAPTGGGTYKFRTTATVPSLSFTEKTISNIENEGTWVYEYNTSGTLVKQCVYKLYGTGALVYDCDDFGGCTPPSAPTAGSNSPVCAGSTLNLTANTISGATYSWTGPNGFTSSSEDPSISGVTTAAAGTYSVTATVSGCTSSAGTVTVTVNSTPSTPTAGSNSPVCQSATINLTCNTVSGATYSWTGPNGYTSSSEDPSRTGATTSMAGTYSVTVTVSGCTSAAGTTTVVIPAFASIGAGSSTTFCPESSVTLYASDGTGYTYQWIKDGSNISGATSDSYTATSSGDYQVKITRPSDGCSAWSAPTEVDETNTHVARITPGGPTTFCSGGFVRLHANTCTGHTYQWQKKDGNGVYQPISGATSDFYDATQSGWYQVRVTKSGNHLWSSGIEVVVIGCRTAENGETPAEMENVSQRALSISPNPTPGEFTVSLSGLPDNGMPMRIEVLNALGQVVHLDASIPAKGSAIQTPVRLDAQLQDGIYLLRVTVGEDVLYSKFVLSR